ncbi:MBL fold metallo-hydrolase [Laceyella tengchongensis]|uniref:MBL fold metallo-hydrolase n=1 Tax=Laceyella tengchongensis TaxID=574699 RepID=UPI0012B9CF74|nr:MBL fold metallo-hydrolase [Laceyella tengchongensis]
MRWTVLGCHSPYPAPGGATLGYLLEADQKRILIDCGSGVLAQLAKMMPIHELDAVFLSHLHHDHISDFFVLQYALLVASNQQKRKRPLPVWAPAEPAHWYAKLSYQNLIDKRPIGTESVSIGKLTFSFHRTDHAIPCYAIRISDGEKTILYGADAGPKTDWLAMGRKPDLFVCEATYLHQELPAHPIGHLSAKQAAEAGVALQAKQLLLTHLYPERDPAPLGEEAQAVFPGPCQVSRIGMQIDV